MSGEIVDLEAFQKYVESQMTEYRFRHTLGVVETAKDLAVIYGENPEKATIAALFHDLAKEFSVGKKKEYCRHFSIVIDSFFSQNISLTHGAIAACIAREEYGIEDEDILRAIDHHTLGSHNMSKLEQIIYLADLIEPNRVSNPELERLRKIAYEDLHRGMKFALQYNVSYLESRNKEVHPMIYSMIEEYNQIK